MRACRLCALTAFEVRVIWGVLGMHPPNLLAAVLRVQVQNCLQVAHHRQPGTTCAVSGPCIPDVTGVCSAFMPGHVAKHTALWWSSLCAQVESKYGHSSSGDPAFPKLQWPSAADCPLCRLPQPEAPSADKAAQGAEPVQWNEGEVHRYLMQHYGRQPDGAASTKAEATAPVGVERSTGGGSAIMQAALEADEEAKASASPLRWITSTAGMCTLLVVAVVLVCLMQQVGGGRRALGMKGPGAQRYMNGRHGRGGPLRIRAGLPL